MDVTSRALVGIRSLASGGLIAAGLVLCLAGDATAQIAETEFRAGDGTAYQLLRVAPPLSAGTERVRITTVAGSSSGVGGCNISQNMPGQVAAGIAGPLPPGQSLHPFNAVVRTGILAPNDINAVAFTDSFGGRLTLGSGASALNICKTAFDCTSAMNVQMLFPLNVATDLGNGAIPAACIANGVSAGALCDGTNIRNTFGFGVPATNDVCNNPAQVTAMSTICGTEPTDGFTLDLGEAIVFIYNTSLSGVGFDVGSAGFNIDTNDDNPPGCDPGEIVGSTTRLDSNPGQPPPTETPTNTPTNTATNTATSTETATATNTATATLTATASITPSNTATETATFTVTPTNTNTPPPTDTRPPIPVVPSPTSPAGLVMIVGLGVGLLWALRRLARTGV